MIVSEFRTDDGRLASYVYRTTDDHFFVFDHSSCEVTEFASRSRALAEAAAIAHARQIGRRHWLAFPADDRTERGLNLVIGRVA